MIYYYLIDLTKPKSSDFLTRAEDVHNTGANQAELSISKNVAETQAIVEVKGDQSPLEQPEFQDTILTVYTQAQHSQIFEYFYTPEWQLSPEE